jgi:large subunit ribosomal protein L4
MSETNFQAAAFTALGTPRDQVPLPADLFDGTVNMPVMHRVVKAFLANQREGNAATKTRSFVTGGNQKPWRQKGTGRARQGSTRSPLWPGGGTVFGPQPRSYDEHVPRKMRLLARKSAFNARARENAIFVIDRFAYEAPRTRTLAGLLVRLGVDGQKVLVLTHGHQPNVHLSGRNLQRVQVLPYHEVSTYHLLWSDVVLIEAGALGQTLAPVAEKEPAPAARRARTAAVEETAEAAPKKTTKSRPAKASAKAPAKARTAPKKASAKAASRTAARKTTRPAARKPAPKKKGK